MLGGLVDLEDLTAPFYVELIKEWKRFLKVKKELRKDAKEQITVQEPEFRPAPA